MSDDRKYRQRGYQDDGPRERRPQTPRKPLEPRDPRMPRDPKVPNMPGFIEVFRCTRCGAVNGLDVAIDTVCAKCGADLHTCAQCTSFDGGARLECTQPITARVSPKDTRNQCQFFSPRIKVERETGSSPAPNSAKKAFDDLFKF